MLKPTECVAMLLAGGQGARLGVLTKSVAKPVVPYGGKYRLIDFPLSNCTNSGIDTVGVLTQYQPLELNEYIGAGQPWDLDRNFGGVHVLPPYQRNKKTDWYKGTANAICQNIEFIARYDPEYVLILGGDHIYKMDYSEMLDEHKKNNADCTIAVLDVTLEEASRFGIMNTNPDGSIYEFEEKPKNPKSTKASMGIYIFNWDKLRFYLEQDDDNLDSSNDFGKDIIPLMLAANEKMMTFQFNGYWKDVGTIESLWEANLDILNPNIELDLSDRYWRIYSRNDAYPPHYIGDQSIIQNSLVSNGCSIDGLVDFSILFPGVTIEPGAIVKDSIIMSGSVIKSGATVQYSIVAQNVVIGNNCVVGARPEDSLNRDDWGIAVIGAEITIGDGAVVAANAMIEQDVPCAPLKAKKNNMPK